MHPVPAREQQRRDSWRALQSAAVELVGRRGFAAVTVDDVAAAAGVSRRTFFNHFPTKVAALFDPDPADVELLDRLLTGADGSAGLWPALRGVWLAFLADHRGLALTPVRRRLVADPELAAHMRSAHLFVEVAMDRWAAGQLPGDPVTASLAVHTAGAVVGSAFATWSPDEPPAAFVAAAARGFDRLAPAFPG
ncbi:TetR family transcriptional regulator [Modestobacter sp. NPDC049651]|uniref:TetR family transcriptional regulator n=1 Tax=unclassified Modestobacter TaxID=2643866 RepID=UPI0033E16B56